MCYERADFEREQDDAAWAHDQEQQGQIYEQDMGELKQLREFKGEICLALMELGTDPSPQEALQVLDKVIKLTLDTIKMP